jgi:hypothetical protein
MTRCITVTDAGKICIIISQAYLPFRFIKPKRNEKKRKEKKRKEKKRKETKRKGTERNGTEMHKHQKLA